MNTFIALFKEKKKKNRTSINFIQKTHSLKIFILIPPNNSSNEINLGKKRMRSTEYHKFYFRLELNGTQSFETI